MAKPTGGSSSEAWETERVGGRPGIPVDALGGPTIDPTKNVLDLVDAAVRRQDDLRHGVKQALDAEHVTLKEHVLALLAAHNTRYEQRHEALQQALQDAIAAQKDAVREAFERQKEAINAALMSAERAVNKAEVAAEKRFEGVNEFRAQLGDQQRTLMPRAEAENRLNALAEKIGVLEGFRTEALSRGTGTREGYGWAIGVIGVIITMLTIAGFVIANASRIP